MKIVILDGYVENPGDLSWSGFEALGEVTVYDRTPKDRVVERIGDAEVVIVNKVVIDEAVLAACPNVKYIGVLATGYNVIDCEAAKARGVIVTNIPAYGTAAVAQYTLAMLLELCHHIGAHSDAVHAGRWENNVDWCFWDTPLIELAGKTLGVIGLGRIGCEVARLARAFGMRVIAYNRSRSEAGEKVAEYVTLDELLRTSDVITLHCPLFPQTQGIINRESIAKMKDGVLLLNTSRGPCVVEQDLADALNAGKIAGAAVDVVSTEPIRGDNPLLTAKNCLITPHIAWASKESRERLMNIAVENLRAWREGKPVNVVNGI